MLEHEVIANPIHNNNAIYIYDAESIEGDSIEEFIRGDAPVENQLEDVLENSTEEFIVGEEILIAEEVIPENIVKKKSCCKYCFDLACSCVCLVAILLIIYIFSGGLFVILAVNGGDDAS